MEKEIEYTEFDSFYVVAGTKYDGSKIFISEDGYEYGMPSYGDCGYYSEGLAQGALRKLVTKISRNIVTDLRVEKAVMYWSSEPIN